MSRKPRIRFSALLCSVVTLAAGLAACGGGSSGGQNSFTYWSMWQQGEDQQKVLSAAFAAFTKQTGIKVNVQWAGRQVLSQVLPRLNSGDPPDLVDQGGTDILGALVPVNGVQSLASVYSSKVDGENDTVSQVIPSSLSSAYRTQGGQPFLVPYEVVGSTAWYNTKRDPDLAAQSSTWPGFLAAMTTLKDAGRTPLALDGDITDYCAYWVYWSLVRMGGAGLLNSSAGDATGKSFDNPAWLKAAQTVEQLIKGGYFPADFTGTKFPTQQTAWADGSSRTDVLLMGSWAASETSAALTKSGENPASLISYASFPFPSFGATDKGDGVVEASPIGFAVPAHARNASAAEKFLTFFMNKDQLSKIATVAKNLTPRLDIPAPPELADYATEYKDAKTYVQAFDGTASTQPKWYTDVWEPAIASFFSGKYDAATFVATLKSQTVALHKNGQ